MRVHSRHKSRNKKIGRIILTVLGLLLLAFLIPAVITGVSRVILYPVYAVQTWFLESTDSLPTFLREKNELLSEIEQLKSKLATAAGTDATQQRLYEENLWLRELLSIEADDRIAAAVTARPNQLPYDFVQIDQGSSDGIVVGAPVYVGIDNVIGLVANVSEHIAFVELFTTPGFEATAFVSGANVTATLEGFGGGVARVRVPQGIPLTVGSVVHVPSVQPGVFGRIAYIENTPTQPEQYGYITLSKPIANIHYVAVGKEPLVPPTETFVRSEIDSLFEKMLLIENLNPGTSQSATTATTGAPSL